MTAAALSYIPFVDIKKHICYDAFKMSVKQPCIRFKEREKIHGNRKIDNEKMVGIRCGKSV